MCVQKEKISIFTSEEKFAQVFSYAGMQRGRTASFLHFSHAGLKNQEQMALQPSLRNLRHTTHFSDNASNSYRLTVILSVPGTWPCQNKDDL